MDFRNTSKVYIYTFHAGSTCASPHDTILIIDDQIKEPNEQFDICFVDHSMPFGVNPGPPSVISINDNDSKCLELIMFTVLYYTYVLYRINMHIYMLLLYVYLMYCSIQSMC